MREGTHHPIMVRIAELKPGLTPKARMLADYVLENRARVVFMTTRQLGETCGVSESTVFRFVNQLGFEGYAEFIRALRDSVDLDLGMPERVELSALAGEGVRGSRKAILEEIQNLKELFETLDLDRVGEVAGLLGSDRPVYVVGSRLSYTFAYYLGWCMTKIRPGVQILKGSDNTAIDWLTMAPPESVVVLLATSRYPNDLIRIARLVRRLGLTLAVIADSPLCPLLQFAHVSLTAPHRSLTILGSPSSLPCLLNCLLWELMSRNREQMRAHQEKLELSYLENDLLFSLHGAPSPPPPEPSPR